MLVKSASCPQQGPIRLLWAFKHIQFPQMKIIVLLFRIIITNRFFFIKPFFDGKEVKVFIVDVYPSMIKLDSLKNKIFHLFTLFCLAKSSKNTLFVLISKIKIVQLLHEVFYVPCLLRRQFCCLTAWAFSLLLSNQITL